MSLLSDLGLDLEDTAQPKPEADTKDATKQSTPAVTLTTGSSSTTTSSIDDFLGLDTSVAISDANTTPIDTSAKREASATESEREATKASTSPSSRTSTSSSGGLSDSGEIFNLLPDMNDKNRVTTSDTIPDTTGTAAKLHAVSSESTAKRKEQSADTGAITTQPTQQSDTSAAVSKSSGTGSGSSSGGSSWSSWRSSLRQRISDAANSDFATSMSSRLTKVASTTKESAFSIATYLQSSGDPTEEPTTAAVSSLTNKDDITFKSGEIAEISKLSSPRVDQSKKEPPKRVKSVQDMVTPNVEKQANDLGMYYITEDKRIVAMEYPSDETILSGTKLGETLSQVVADSTADTFATSQPSSVTSDKSSSTTSSVASYLTSKVASTLIPSSKAEKVSRFLKKNHVRHGSSFMIWNLSEVNYTQRMQEVLFDNSVLDFKFPGYPCPPLQQLFEILASIQNWLNASETNIALIHCQTGKGRTVTVISAYLAWAGLVDTPAKALLHTVSQMNGTVKSHTIPSQTRYLAYLTQLLVEKQKPLDRPIVIERILVHGIPYFEISKNSTYYATRSYLREKHRQWESGDDSMTAGKVAALDSSTVSDPTSSADQSNSADGASKAAVKSESDKTTSDDGGSAKPSPKKRKRASLLDGTDLSDEEEEEDDEELELGATAVVSSPKSPSPKKQIQSEVSSPPKPAVPRPPVLKYSPTKEDMGFRPYIQIFKDAKLIWSSRTDAKREFRKRMKEKGEKSSESSKSSVTKTKKLSDLDILDFYDQSDRVVKFSVGGTSGGSCPLLQGDMLVRIRHICCGSKNSTDTDTNGMANSGGNGRKVSVCRFSFHTGYVAENGLIRFRKSQLDGAWNSDRFPSDFSIDLITGAGPDLKSNIISTNGGLKDIVVTASFWDDIDRHTLTGQSDKRRLKRLEYERNRDERRKKEKKKIEKAAQSKQSSSQDGSIEAVDLLGIDMSSAVDDSEKKKKSDESGSTVKTDDDITGADAASAASPKFTLGGHEEEEISFDHSSDDDEEVEEEEKKKKTEEHKEEKEETEEKNEDGDTIRMNDDNLLFGDANDHLDELEAMAEHMELGSDDEDLLNELEAIAADDTDELLP